MGVVSKILGDIAAHCQFDLVRVQSHCGFTRNEHVDELAEQPTTISLDEQVQVPIDFADVKQRVWTSPGSNRSVDRVPEHLPLGSVMLVIPPKLHPVASYLNGTSSLWPCSLGVTKDEEHDLLRSPDRSTSRRSELRPPRYDSKTDNKQVAGEGAGLRWE